MTDARARRLQRFAFCGAVLAFALEPLVGRLMLPTQGGGAHVWTTCLAFFQGMLLLGYAYAHFVAARIGRWHLAVLALLLWFLPIGIDRGAQAGSALAIAAALLRDVAVPFGLLATTSVVAQDWLARSDAPERGDPYFLYSASNAGSLVGLLAYPFVVEPLLGLRAQRWIWSALCVGYLLLALAAAPRGHGRPAASEPAAAPAPRDALAWLLLSASPVVLLMAVTQFLSAELGSVPLVWVVPLALYLATFVICFGRRPWMPRALARFWPELAFAGFLSFALRAALDPLAVIAIQLAALFGLCWVAHSALHRTRPPAEQLTAYWLIVGAGGFVAGATTSLLAPHVFTRLVEYPLALALLIGTFAWLGWRDLRGWMARREARAERIVRAVLAAGTCVVAVHWLALPERETGFALRNAYGIYQVYDGEMERGGSTAAVRYLVHSGTTHGVQALAGPERARAIGYYTRLGDVFARLPAPRRIAVVGLGAGGMAAHLAPGDSAVFYELDPDNEPLARRWFSYLDDAPGAVRIVAGDARIELARDPEAPAAGFDAIFVDAFSGDAIPTHLLTREAIALYFARLREGGLLLFHVSNRYYDLQPVLATAARERGLTALVYRTRVREPLELAASLLAMSSDAALHAALRDAGWRDAIPGETLPRTAAWTDDYVNVLAPLWLRIREQLFGRP
jgi:hypothetical protein